MLTFDTSALIEDRLQIHWASQLLSAAADVQLPAAEDDSHSNLEWNAESRSLVNRGGVSLSLSEFEVHFDGESFALDGATLESSADWLSNQLKTPLRFRDYDMPDHAVRTGQAFSTQREHRTALSEWFSFGQSLLQGYGELRVWPHHFDLGFWNPGVDSAKSIGGGFSLGDPTFDRPYFYINPYGIERPEQLPELPVGSWVTQWLGAVLTADGLASSDDPAALAGEFLRVAMMHCKSLIE